MLQQRQQAGGSGTFAADLVQQGAAGVLSALAPPPDPADSVWAADAARAAWLAARQLPGALAGLIEAVAVLRRHMAMLDLAAAKLPPVQRAVTAAAKASEAVGELAALFDGAEWPAGAEGGAAGAANDPPLAGLRLAPGADAAYDAAAARLAAADAQLQEATQEVLAAFGGAAPPQAAAGKKGRSKQGQVAAVPLGASVHSAAEGLLQVSGQRGQWPETAS